MILSHLDDLGKSGSAYARWYAEENGIFVNQIVPRDSLARELAAQPDVQTVVFVDDFVGTGDSGAKYLKELVAQSEQLRSDVKWKFVAISGFAGGAQKIENAARKLELDVEVRICDPLSDDDRAFEGTQVYRDETDRAEARAVAYEYGAPLVSNDPLGYGDLQALVVFDSSIPNNCPPILWHNRNGWIPIFKRM